MTITKQAYLISKDSYSKGTTFFYTNATDILKHYKCNTQIPDLESTSIRSLDFITKSIKQKYITFRKHEVENSSKLSFYCTFKEDWRLEKYLTTIKDINIKKNKTPFTRFRISNHKLMIEYSRYQKITQEERLCMFCQSNEVEDEYHFTMSCEAYASLRNNFLSTLSNASTIDTNQRPDVVSRYYENNKQWNHFITIKIYLFKFHGKRTTRWSQERQLRKIIKPIVAHSKWL